MKENITAIIAIITAKKPRSAWDRGVKEYALELLESVAQGIEDGYYYDDDILSPRLLEKMMLNGASDWREYSWGGCALIYDGDIARRLCAPYELKRTHDGPRRPNATEEWLDVQCRALNQAADKILRAAKTLRR